MELELPLELEVLLELELELELELALELELELELELLLEVELPLAAAVPVFEMSTELAPPPSLVPETPAADCAPASDPLAPQPAKTTQHATTDALRPKEIRIDRPGIIIEVDATLPETGHNYNVLKRRRVGVCSRRRLGRHHDAASRARSILDAALDAGGRSVTPITAIKHDRYSESNSRDCLRRGSQRMFELAHREKSRS